MLLRLTGYLVAGCTIFFNYWVYSKVATSLGFNNPYSLAVILILALVIHESFHLIAYEINRVPAGMIFLFVIGSAGPLPGFSKKFNLLSWERRAIVGLAGVTGNLLYMMAALLCQQLQIISQADLLRVLNLNGVLILWNLFPTSRADGGRFTKLLFNSISENRDTDFEIGLSIGFVFILIVILFLVRKIDFMNVALFAWGLHYQANHDNPQGSANFQAIPEPHQKWWALAYLAFISVGAVLTSSTPSWIS